MIKHGIIILDKPTGMTSHTAVSKVKRLTGVEKAGHTGTLDPAATGVMTIMLNSAVKASSYLTEHDKTYTAKLVLGIETDTQDTTGNILRSFDGELPDFEAVKAVLGDFTGVISQIPPMYSALKHNGKKLYEIARTGGVVERAPRKVKIYSLKAENREDGIYLNVHCSKGTYIRTLCNDIGKRLGCGAAMGSLVRTSVGEFSINAAVGLSELENMCPEEIENVVIPTESLFSSLRRLEVSGFFEKLAKNGAEVYLQKIGMLGNYTENDWVRLCGEDGFFALGRIHSYPAGLAVKAETMFL